MSKFSIVYDQIRTVLATLYPNKTELTNPDDLSQNENALLRDGYGVIVGIASPEPFDFTEYLEGREFTIVLTKEIYNKEGDKNPLITAKKEMIEDTVILKQDFLANDQIEVSSSIQEIELGTSSGIDFIPDTANFLTASATFTIRISEIINT